MPDDELYLDTDDPIDRAFLEGWGRAIARTRPRTSRLVLEAVRKAATAGELRRWIELYDGDKEAAQRAADTYDALTDENGVLTAEPHCDIPRNDDPGIRVVGSRDLRGRRVPGKS